MAQTTTEREAWRDQYDRDVLDGAENNHIWINAFACVNPSDDLLRQVGRQVLAMLELPECCHTSQSGHMLGLPSQREVVLRVNKS